ncbi:MAG: A/G-specific adenine glycosylase [Chloroflexi bacterium]|nr:A/G-specific adenine glycosylase [Chloroflexota bacterium]
MDAGALHQAVSDWYAANARDLPWRSAPFLGDPYAVLVSEVMLQQTQVDRTIPKFLAFMDRFPTVAALAVASPGEVITLWAGMGYNNRAVRLHRLAQQVTQELAGVLPKDVELLRALPGIGPYTAAAVACFAFNAAVPVLDTNIYRVLSRVAHGVHAPSRSELEPLASELLSGESAPLDASAWHQALMDIGATICTKSRPRCMLCPLREQCAAAPALQDGVDRNLAEASVPYAPKQGRFAGSTRYYRGRIVEALRKGEPLNIASLQETLNPGAGVDLEPLIAGIISDGLAVREDNTLRLP